jgi:hypothetical protein
MLKNFRLFNTNGIEIPVDVAYPIEFFKNVDHKTFNEFYDGSRIGISWEYEGGKTALRNPDKSILGFPTVDLKYVVAIYSGSKQGHPFEYPNNAVVYNLDGTINVVLGIPKLESATIVNRIEFFKENNPPLEAASYEGGLFFDNFDWYKSDTELHNRIRIIYDREWLEYRELFPENGEIGKLLGGGRL